jgi:hypothetical protein
MAANISNSRMHSKDISKAGAATLLARMCNHIRRSLGVQPHLCVQRLCLLPGEHGCLNLNQQDRCIVQNIMISITATTVLACVIT